MIIMKIDVGHHKQHTNFNIFGQTALDWSTENCLMEKRNERKANG